MDKSDKQSIQWDEWDKKVAALRKKIDRLGLNIKLIDLTERVSGDLAKGVLKKVAPATLQRFERVEKSVFEGKYGLPEDLEFAAAILQAIAHAIYTRGEAIDKATALEEVVGIVLDGVSDQLSKVGRKAEAGQVVKELEATFVEHPSLIDRVASAAIPPFETKKEQMLKMENDLRRCVLRVLNRSEGWMGTAFTVGDGRLFLTVAHMISREGKDKLVLIFDGTVRVERHVSLVALKREMDIAVLELKNEGMLDDFKEAGLRPYPHSLRMRKDEDVKGHPVLCLGYHAEEVREGVRILSPCPATAHVVQHCPIREVEFQGEGTQRCLIMVVSEGGETVRRGMSGGPILDLKTGEIIAMITGAQQEGRLHQPLGNPEELPIAEYAFGVFLSDVAERWSEFKKCFFTAGSF